MTSLAGRAAALVGWLAHATGRLLGGIIWFAPRGAPWALVIAALLGVSAWRSVEDARFTTAGQPRPEPVGLADVVDLRAIGWVGTSSIVRGPFLDSSSYGAPVQRWYYLLLDPLDDAVALIARSAERLEDRRTRTIVARVEGDPTAVASALGGLTAGTLAVDSVRYLVELPGRRPSVLTGDAVASPAGPGLQPGEVVLHGSFAEASRAADGAGWEYLVTDRGRAVVVRSPYPPDALPVDVWGVATTDRVRAEQAAAVTELQAALAGRRLPERRLLAEGVTPPLPQVSYLPAMILATLAATLVIGWLTGYPIFRRRPLPAGISSWPMRPGDELPADLYGTDRRGTQRTVVDGAPARLALLPPDELERRTWQYGLGEAGLAAAPVHDAAAGPGVLTLSSGEGPILLELDPAPDGLSIASGTLVEAGRARPALRIRAAGIDLVAAFASVAARDRAVVAIAPDRLASIRDDEPPRPAIERPQPTASGTALPLPVRTAVFVLAAVGTVFVAGGAIGLPSAIAGRSEMIPSVAQLAAGMGFLAVARGLWLRRGWALGVGFNVAWVGAAISAFLIFAAPQCGLWLAPNLAACEAVGPLGSIAALAAAIGLAYAAVAIRRHASVFVG
ncbi:MAG TPA: hypothetical protein VEW95_12145 [Candidatus Limnocylindrales bacterium]|nr:hypothetical protein [Candidatus Limnocylindrales bacterium]